MDSNAALAFPQPAQKVPVKGQFLTIIEPDAAPFDWQFYDDERDITYATVFQLRVVPDEEQERLKKQYTTEKRIFNKKTRAYDVEKETDYAEYTKDALDYGIVAWRDLKNAKGEDVPCTRAAKLALPVRVRIEIQKVILNREVSEEQETDRPNG